MPTRKQLRQTLKQRRAAHSIAECMSASDAICQHIYRSRVYRYRKRIALYYAVANEVNLELLMQHAWQAHKRVFLPVLSLFPKGKLWWIPCDEHTPLYANRFNIPEPIHSKHQRRTQLRSLDLLFMPLLGYDHVGNRLGMGGGFYDRSLSVCGGNTESQWRRPLRIGVAYSWQKVDTIPSESWDIPLDAVVTEHGFTWFRR